MITENTMRRLAAECDVKPSVLILPPQREQVSRKFGPLELVRPEHREAAKNALVDLFKAAGLNYPGSLAHDASDEVYATRLELWERLATALLGDDMPEQEILC